MKRRIVIADDDPMIISLVSLRLEIAGYEVLPARNGAEALALIRKIHPAAIILDIDMPGMSGIEALDAIKADPAIDKLPVMILTGERNTETVMQAMGSGASDYLVKPFQPDRLLDRVNRMVQAGVAQRMQTPPVWQL
jgi:two-component system phosphate regulon response regulator PhoB